MKNRVWYVLVIALFAAGALSACKSLPPQEATQRALDDTRTLIEENVADEANAKKLVVLTEELADDVKAYEKKYAEINVALVKKNADYDATREDMQKLYDKLNEAGVSIAKRIAERHTEMQKLVTVEEWGKISRPKHRIGGL